MPDFPDPSFSQHHKGFLQESGWLLRMQNCGESKKMREFVKKVIKSYKINLNK
jgi:hypothetical protein